MRRKSLLCMICVFVLLVGFNSCNKLENMTNSSVKLILWSLSGLDDSGEDTTMVLCDVLRNGSVFNDNANASFTAALLDPTKINPEDSTFYQDVIIDQIDIRYTRADGLNVEGVDVPYAFSQRTHLLVQTGETSLTNLSFIMVQHNAKVESPLVELVHYGQEHVLKLEAHITFYAKDIAGNRLEPVTGAISVWCSNFADPE